MTTTGLAFSQTFAYDEAPGFVKRALGSAAVTATAYIGTQLDQGAATLTDMACIITIEAIDIASTNEIYTFRIVGSNVADRSDGEILETAQCGVAATITIETRNTVAGDRIVMNFRTEKNRTAFRYIDLHLTAAGTTPSITFGAYLAKKA
jgi:hypothetical protein